MTNERDAGPRVLFVSAIGGNGGPVRSLVQLVDALELSWRGVAGPFIESVRQEFEATADRVIHTASWQGMGRARAVGQLARALRTHRPDVVFANGLTEAAAASLALGTLHRPPRLAVWVHNSSVPTITRTLGPLLRRQRGTWAAVSEWAAALTEDSVGPVGCSVIPNPVSESDVGSRTTRPDDRVRIGYFGSDRAHKGFALLPDVIESLADAHVVWRLYTWPVVEQPAWARIRQLQERGLIEHVQSVSDVGAGYASVDVVFVPSLVESFCRVVAEANLNSLPVVASDLPAIREITQPERTAVLFPTGDAEAAAAALRTILADPVAAAEMGARGRRAGLAFAPGAVASAWQARIETLRQS